MNRDQDIRPDPDMELSVSAWLIDTNPPADEAEQGLHRLLQTLMSRNRHMRVFLANGLYDLATPYFATQYTFSHMGLDPELRDNVVSKDYEAGHMMYVHRPSLEQLAQDLRAFITD